MNAIRLLRLYYRLKKYYPNEKNWYIIPESSQPTMFDVISPISANIRHQWEEK